MQMPTSPEAILNNLVCREVVDPTPQDEPPSPTIPIFSGAVGAVTHGTALNRTAIERVMNNQLEKAEMVAGFLRQLDFESAPAMAEIIYNTERMLRNASRRGDLSVSEAMALWQTAMSRVKDVKMTTERTDKLTVDSATMFEKIDYTTKQVERGLSIKFRDTSPHGRELMRKKLWELKQNLIKDAIPVEATTSPT